MKWFWGQTRGDGAVIRKCCVFFSPSARKARERRESEREREREDAGGGLLPEGERWNIERAVLI